MKPSLVQLSPPLAQNAPPTSLEMNAGKVEMTSEAETEMGEDGDVSVLHDHETTEEPGCVSKPGDRLSEDRGRAVTVGVANASPGACGAEHAVAGDNVCCGEGRVWIFLVLGLMMLVFCGAVVGVYMTVRTLTSSLGVLEVMPTYVPVAAVSLTISPWKSVGVHLYTLTPV
ncbi:hypothetical protein RRG08_055822 [Elysia crispata]|uniref:Transmembrane protein n=1 Tax=Elysia crispata TaxID=231223 RepID=A0AAE1AX16_9GAST|nr:hypothetical protein RRG08_055822 [Elysia crispata]